MKTCSIEGCEKSQVARGWCGTHWKRWRRGAELSAPVIDRQRGELTYFGAHQRLTRTHGRAADHACRHCLGTARDWAYDHKDPDEKTQVIDGYLMAYSLNLAHYLPLCKSCHTRFDSRKKEIA